MVNPKNICIFAVVGFLLSFFIGLFSDVRFLSVVLRALVSGVGFAALYIGIGFIYQKFLSYDNSSLAADSDLSAQKNVTGGIVNIVVDDSNLPDDGNSPKFNVMNNHHSDLVNSKPEEEPAPQAQNFSDSKTAVENEVPAEPAAASSFQPVSLASSPVQKSSPAPKMPDFAPVAAAASISPAESVSGEENSLDELPDLGGMGTEIETGSSASDLESGSAAEVIQDSEFATGGSKLKEQPISGDTNVMAKAIQTLLAQEN